MAYLKKTSQSLSFIEFFVLLIYNDSKNFLLSKKINYIFIFKTMFIFIGLNIVIKHE